MFSPSFVDELRCELKNQFDSLMGAGAGRDYLEVGDRRPMLSPQLKGPLLHEQVYGHPLLLKIVQQLLGSDVLIDNITCSVALPGAEEQHLHLDHPHLFHELKDTAVRVSLVLIFPGGMDWEGPTTEAALPYTRRCECFLMDLRMCIRGRRTCRRHRGRCSMSSTRGRGYRQQELSLSAPDQNRPARHREDTAKTPIALS